MGCTAACTRCHVHQRTTGVCSSGCTALQKPPNNFPEATPPHRRQIRKESRLDHIILQVIGAPLFLHCLESRVQQAHPFLHGMSGLGAAPPHLQLSQVGSQAAAQVRVAACVAVHRRRPLQLPAGRSGA